MKLPLHCPSSRSSTLFGVASVVVSIVCWSELVVEGDGGSGAKSSLEHLKTYFIAATIGLGIGLVVTSAGIFIGRLVQTIVPVTWALEPREKAVGVACSFLALHMVLFAVLHTAGTLPIGWPWWLGAFGFLFSPDIGWVVYVP